MRPVDKELKARLTSGDLEGEALQFENQIGGGLVVIEKDGKKRFVRSLFADLLRYRNRGKD